ncbi:histidinol-phosphate transaminase [Nigerium massiliense]|uniref:histidinol-phosphate transaminase n=1 Tax=Nigerium massiliense TaxID=1522317 RepID=UPI00058D47AB|nr:histidinol-phosphate transaminase [Nigerium massiliense]
MTDLFSQPSVVRLRPALDGVPAYVSGKPAAPLPGVTTYKMSSNENPYPPLPSVLEVIARAASVINRYPDMNNVALKAAIATSCARRAENIVVGPGSTGVLAQIIQATCDAGDEVVFAWRSFEAYPILVQLAGAVPVQVPLTDTGDHDLRAMASAITARTRLVLLCSPNNPSGTVISDADARAFLAQVPPSVAVVLDEAYGEFVSDEDAADGLSLQADFPNLITARTFSKAYGLAGLRVGYAVAHPTLAEAFAKTAIPFGVNVLAQAAAVHSLSAADELAERVRQLIAERERVADALALQGWRLPRSQANFVHFPLGEQSAAFNDACDAAGLVVRLYGTDGVRVTISEREANDRLLQVADAFLAGR